MLAESPQTFNVLRGVALHHGSGVIIVSRADSDAMRNEYRFDIGEPNPIGSRRR